MYEIQVAGRRLSEVGRDIRALKIEAQKVVGEEMKKVKGLLANLQDEHDINLVSTFAARAYQHVKNAVSISTTVGIPVEVHHRDVGKFLFNVVSSHPLYHDSAEMVQLGISLEIIETNPTNWV